MTDGPLILSLGKPFGEWTSWEPGLRWQYDAGGHMLIACFSDPSVNDIAAVSAEDLEFGLFVRDELIVMLIRAGTLAWMDVEFCIHKIPQELWPELEVPVLPHEHVLVSVVLVDTSATVRALRAVTWSPAFGKRFMRAVLAQSRRPYNEAAFTARLRALYTRYSTRELLALCEIRTIGGA